MEEIDAIIIQTLKNLNCDISEEIDGLKQFDVDLVVLAISRCLEAIIPMSTFPKRLPPNMTLKLQVTSQMAQQIKDLGFQDDIGYQTILYFNEVEVRRVLMFLIEKLPRETGSLQPSEDVGYVLKLVQEIEAHIKSSLDSLWLPSGVLNRGTRDVGNYFDVNSFGESTPLETVTLKSPKHDDLDEASRYYYNQLVPDVTKQCLPHQFIPSLLFKDCEFDLKQMELRKYLEDIAISEISKNTESQGEESIQNALPNERSSGSHDPQKVEDNLAILLNDIELGKNVYLKLLEEVKNLGLKLSQINKEKEEEEEFFKNSMANLEIKTKTLFVLNKDENVSKLKQQVENASDRLVELAHQWNQVQTPLLEEFKSLKNNLSSEELKMQEAKDKLKIMNDVYNILVTDAKDKEKLEQTLIKKVQQINKNNNRSAYTRRIMEIIGNIKKQNLEIQKVLKDTREVQKDINILTGQVDRSFTLSDELIFQNAKHDEMSRKAYKLLAALRDECANIINSVSDLGSAERESRNLQEQIDIESSKEISVKLARVNRDLEGIKLENEKLLQSLNN